MQITSYSSQNTQARVLSLIYLFLLPNRRLGTKGNNDYLMGNLNYKQLSNGKTVVLIPLYSATFPTELGNDNANLSTSPYLRVSEQAERLSQLLANSDLRSERGINLELRFIKLQYPYLDSLILAQYTALNTGKYPFARIHDTVFKKRLFCDDLRSSTKESSAGCSQTEFGKSLENIPYLLKGLKLELAGRLTTQRTVPRKTVFNKHIGTVEAAGMRSTSNTKKNPFNQYASKNKLGAYTIKTWLA